MVSEPAYEERLQSGSAQSPAGLTSEWWPHSHSSHFPIPPIFPFLPFLPAPIPPILSLLPAPIYIPPCLPILLPESPLPFVSWIVTFFTNINNLIFMTILARKYISSIQQVKEMPACQRSPSFVMKEKPLGNGKFPPRGQFFDTDSSLVIIHNTNGQ